MRVVVDTGVLVSGLISRSGAPARVLDLWAAGTVTVLVSEDLAKEYREVLSRPRFATLGTIEERMELLHGLIGLSNVEAVEISETVDVVREDPDDNRVLECAASGAAEVVVTGDQDLLRLSEFRGIRILSPRQFIEKLEPLARQAPGEGSSGR